MNNTTPQGQPEAPSGLAVPTGSGVRLRAAYRTLNYLEEICQGDEVDACRDPMRDAPQWVPATNVGDVSPDPAYPAHRIYRRPLHPNNPVSNAAKVAEQQNGPSSGVVL